MSTDSKLKSKGRSAGMEARIEELEKRVARLSEGKADLVSLVCFSGEWDRLFAAFTIANGALALGQEVHMFFTFWAVGAVRKATKSRSTRSIFDRLIDTMIPAGVRRARLSKMHCCGMGKLFLGRRMKKYGIDDLDVLVERAREMGAHFHLCDTSAALLGIGNEELLADGEVDLCGVATFLSKAAKGNLVLLI